jgi:GNAT superfamily N-acetyltransferase
MQESTSGERISFRPARPQDFDFCAALYFASMKEAIRGLNLDVKVHTADFRRRWRAAQVRIITLDGADIGWLQTAILRDALFLAQLFVDAPFRQQGIGTAVMQRLIDEATQAGRAMTLAVVKSNPVRRLYERLGFRITHEDDRKVYMRRDVAAPLPG